MTFLNKIDAGKYTALGNTTSTPKTHIEELDDRSDRTLTVGERGNGVYVHTYIENGELCVHHYSYDYETGESVTFFTLHGEEIPNNYMIPTVSSAPRATDAEFAALMFKKGTPLHFCEFGSYKNKLEPLSGMYFGLRFHSPRAVPALV